MRIIGFFSSLCDWAFILIGLRLFISTSKITCYKEDVSLIDFPPTNETLSKPVTFNLYLWSWSSSLLIGFYSHIESTYAADDLNPGLRNFIEN